jgi:hypothetical protein
VLLERADDRRARTLGVRLEDHMHVTAQGALVHAAPGRDRRPGRARAGGVTGGWAFRPLHEQRGDGADPRSCHLKLHGFGRVAWRGDRP